MGSIQYNRRHFIWEKQIMALTKQDMIELLDKYISPIYHIIGAVCALIVIVAAIILIIKPFIKRI